MGAYLGKRPKEKTRDQQNARRKENSSSGGRAVIKANSKIKDGIKIIFKNE